MKNPEELDTLTLRELADGIEGWANDIVDSLYKDKIVLLTPEEVGQIILGGIVDSIREDVFDIDLRREGLASEG